MIQPGRKYEATNSYRYGFGGQEKSNEIRGEGNSYTAEFWEYDVRSGRRWNKDPRPNLSISVYAVLANNPIGFTDPLGDTTRYVTKDNKLILTTYAKGYNHTLIIEENKMDKIKNYACDWKDVIDKFKDNITNFEAVDKSLKDVGVTYDIQSFEKFHADYYKKGAGAITNFGGWPISDLSNIKVDGKPYTNEEFRKYVNSFNVGPEYIASIQKGTDGVVRVGVDVSNDNDLISATPMSRISHIHLHPAIAMKKISYDYVIKDGPYKGNSFHHDLFATKPDLGPDEPDRSSAHFSVWSVVVNNQKVYLYNGSGNNINTIPFDRKTRK